MNLGRCNHLTDPGGQGEATFSINISSDAANATIGQPVNIFINLTNSNDTDADSTTMTATFNDIIERPTRIININKYDICKADDDNQGHNLSVDNENKYYEISIDNKGKLKIIFSIKSKTSILIIYKTRIADEGAFEQPEKIIDEPELTLAEHISCKNITIGTIEKEKKTQKNNLIIDYCPKHNRTTSEPNLTVFEYTTLQFLKFQKIENATFYDNFTKIDQNCTNSNNNYTYTCPPGSHIFSAIIENPDQVIIMNNSSVFEAVDLIKHHRDLAWSKGIILSLVVVILLLIAFVLHYIFGRNNICLIVIISGLTIAAYLKYSYDYFFNDIVYNDIIALGYISLAAGLYLMLHIYYRNQMDIWMTIMQALAMILVVISYNYNLPFILSNVCISFILSFATLIVTTILEVISKKSALKPIVAGLMIDAGVFATLIVPIFQSGFTFSSRFELNSLFVIFLLEIIPIIIIAIACAKTGLVLQFLKDRINIKSSSNESDEKKNAE